MAAAPTSTPAARVRLLGPALLLERAAWALEALLARARVREWLLVDDAAAPVDLELTLDAGQWQFTWDRVPDGATDPLAATFWWLARVEEQLAPPDAFDEHGRFRADHSAMVRSGDPLATPVDDLAMGLAKRLADHVAPRAAGEVAWRVVATHDIDLPWRWTRVGRRRALRSIREDLRRGRVGRALRTFGALAAMPAWRLRGGDPWCNARRIHALEADEGATSTSYLLAATHVPEDGDAELYVRGARYATDLAGLGPRELVGLHGSYTSSDVDGRLERERVAIEQRTAQPVVDHRFHYLRHRPVAAWPLLDGVGLRTDASLGFAEQPGFRAGTAHPYRAWDFAEGRPLDLVVIPLAVMDASFDARYLGAGRRERARLVHEVVDRIRAAGGSASLLVHNDRLCNAADDGWTTLYREVLRSVRGAGGQVGTAAAAAEAYLERVPAARRTRGAS